MGKDNKDPVKTEFKDKDKEKPHKTKATKKEPPPETMLGKLRPKQRVIFFILWLVFAAWTLFIYDPCNIASKNRKDCGYPDITGLQCRSSACFLKGGGSALAKKTVKVKRKEGTTMGLDVGNSGKASLVNSIADGSAVSEHNAQLPADSTEVIRVGDRIAKIDGKGIDGMTKVLKATGGKAVQVEILRPKLPSYLMWISSKTSTPNVAEKLLTAPGFKQWTVASSYFGGVGMMCWLLSGFPVSSLPVYYFGLSGVLAFGTMRCCHDDSIAGGVPHCYKPRYSKFLEEIVPKIKDETTVFFAKIRKNPKIWFKKTFTA